MSPTGFLAEGIGRPEAEGGAQEPPGQAGP